MSQIIQIDRSLGFAFMDTSRGYQEFPFLKGWVFGELDIRSIPLFQIDTKDICLLKPTTEIEIALDGITRLSRLRQSGRVLLDIAFFQTFWEKKELIPKEFKQDGVIISFDGTLFCNAHSAANAVVVMWWSSIEDKWFCDLRCLSKDFSAKFVSATMNISA